MHIMYATVDNTDYSGMLIVLTYLHLRQAMAALFKAQAAVLVHLICFRRKTESVCVRLRVWYVIS